MAEVKLEDVMAAAEALDAKLEQIVEHVNGTGIRIQGQPGSDVAGQAEYAVALQLARDLMTEIEKALGSLPAEVEAAYAAYIAHGRAI